MVKPTTTKKESATKTSTLPTRTSHLQSERDRWARDFAIIAQELEKITKSYADTSYGLIGDIALTAKMGSSVDTLGSNAEFRELHILVLSDPEGYIHEYAEAYQMHYKDGIMRIPLRFFFAEDSSAKKMCLQKIHDDPRSTYAFAFRNIRIPLPVGRFDTNILLVPLQAIPPAVCIRSFSSHTLIDLCLMERYGEKPRTDDLLHKAIKNTNYNNEHFRCFVAKSKKSHPLAWRIACLQRWVARLRTRIRKKIGS